MSSKFPSTRYQGSKAKLVDWIWGILKEIEFQTCLDAFGGTGAVAYKLKQEEKAVTYNDILCFNHIFGTALIENDDVRLEAPDVDGLFGRRRLDAEPTFVQDTFEDIYFTNEENRWIDRAIHNISLLMDPKKRALAFFALAQSCIVKRPYNLFHRKNLYIRLADVNRTFGNKVSWDRSFEDWFRRFVVEANSAVFAGKHKCVATQANAVEVPGDFDLVYVDTPYISRKGVAVDYRDFYHFLEGLCCYKEWLPLVDFQSRHRRMKRIGNPWCDKNEVEQAFDDLFERFSTSILAVSYRSDGVPSIERLREILLKHKKTVRVEVYGRYKYVLSRNSRTQEILLVAA